MIKDLLKFIQKYDFEAYAVVVEKSRIFGVPTLSSDETLHGYPIKELLLKINTESTPISCELRHPSGYSFGVDLTDF